MADAAGDDEELAGLKQDVTAVGCGTPDAQLAAQDEEHFVFMGMGVPGKFTLDTRYLDVLIVYLPNDSRRPEIDASITESTTSEFERDRMLLHR